MQNSLRQGLEPMLVGVALDNLPQMMQMLPTGDIHACVSCMRQRMRNLAKHMGELIEGQVVLAAPPRPLCVFAGPQQRGPPHSAMAASLVAGQQ